VSKYGRNSILKFRKPIPPTGGEMKSKKEYTRKKQNVRRFIERQLEEYEELKEEVEE